MEVETTNIDVAPRRGYGNNRNPIVPIDEVVMKMTMHVDEVRGHKAMLCAILFTHLLVKQNL